MTREGIPRCVGLSVGRITCFTEFGAAIEHERVNLERIFLL